LRGKIASSRRSFSWGVARKTASEKLGEKRGKRKLSVSFFRRASPWAILSLAVFRVGAGGSQLIVWKRLAERACLQSNYWPVSVLRAA